MAIELDVLIFGGGGAGLWLLDVLRRSGRRVMLIERTALGTGQTVAAQGIIHGGVKYSLKGVVSASAKAIREMPPRWRASLSGSQEPDLSAVRLRADYCWLWRTASIKSRLGMVGARAGLVVKPVAATAADRPAALANCPGEVYRLDEPVIDTVSFLNVMADRNRRLLIHGEPTELTPDRVCIAGLDLRPQTIVLTAGAGNAALCEQLSVTAPQAKMQRRPLHMTLARGADLPPLNGHCVDGGRTRVTITSDTDAAGRIVWQIGGQLAEDGVDMDPRKLIQHAKRELADVLPGVQLPGEWATYRVDRAEGATDAGQRPEDVQLVRQGGVIVAWPTKLALAPHLADRITAQLEPESSNNAGEFEGVDAPRPPVAPPPWEAITSWNSDI